MGKDDVPTKVEVVDRETRLEKWLRPILVAAIPAIIAVWGVVRTDANRAELQTTETELKQTKDELQRTRDALESAREELKKYSKDAARDEVERANEHRIAVAKVVRRAGPSPGPWPMALPPDRIEAMERRALVEAATRDWKGKEPPNRRYLEQAVAELAVEKER